MKMIFDEQLGDYICYADKPVCYVQSVEPEKDYSLLLTFGTGEKRVYNAKPLLEKNIYAPLKSVSFFMTARVAGDTVVWNDDIDIAPEHLYECSQPI